MKDRYLCLSLKHPIATKSVGAVFHNTIGVNTMEYPTIGEVSNTRFYNLKERASLEEIGRTVASEASSYRVVGCAKFKRPC